MKAIKEICGGLAYLLTVTAAVLLCFWLSAHPVRAESWESLGEMRITHYCPCAKCCGKAGRPTASGVMPERFRTVAVDPDQIPFGTVLYIEGYGYRVAEDAGVGWDCIDVFTDTHTHALELGKVYREVWIVREEGSDE